MFLLNEEVYMLIYWALINYLFSKCDRIRLEMIFSIISEMKLSFETGL